MPYPFDVSGKPAERVNIAKRMGKIRKTKTAVDFGYEVQLRQLADTLRGIMGVC